MRTRSVKALVDGRHAPGNQLDLRSFERAVARSAFLERWFRASIEGLENLPAERGALLVSNHGHLGLDLSVLIKLIYDRTGRPVRGLGDHVIFGTPGIRQLARQLGVVEGTQPNAIGKSDSDFAAASFAAPMASSMVWIREEPSTPSTPPIRKSICRSAIA